MKTCGCRSRRERPVAALLLVLFALVSPASLRAQAPAPPAAAISGTVLDDETGEPVIDAGVEVVGQNKKTRTDVDGQYRIPIAPGEYQVRFFAAGYQSARIEKVKVVPDQAALADVTLKPETEAAAGEDVVEVVADAQKATEAAQLVARQKADVVEDTIGAETFQKAPDSDAAEVVARVPSVTIRDDFVFVRGLGERYSSALLNGSRLPSTNPNKRVIPLDLFPADFIDSIAIIKSYTPNLPGDFAGGLVDINLASYPDVFGAKAGAKLGFNTNATFSKFDTYRKARQFPEFFGVDTVRELPSIFGDNAQAVRQQIGADPGLFAAALENIWSPKTITAPPNSSVDLEVGNDFGDFGVQLAASWGNKYIVQPNSIQRQFKTLDQGEPVVDADFVYDFDTWETELGAVLSSGYDIDDDNRLSFRALYQRQTADEVEQGLGTRENLSDTTQIKVTRLEYTQEDLAYGQLSGTHHVDDVFIDGLNLDWRTAYSRTTLDKPDTRQTQYTSDAGAPFQWDSSGGGAQRFWLDVEDRMTDSAVDLVVPIRTLWGKLMGRFSTGPAYTYRERSSNLRRFLYRRGVNPPDFTLPPEQILNPANVDDGSIQFREESQETDNFDASEEIAGYYGMIDLPILKDTLRAVTGVRVEYSQIRILFSDPVSEFQGKEEKRLTNTDPMPSASLIWTPLSDMNVRAGWSQTVSRPEFRELSPILFPEPLGLRPTVGNPDLVETNITNYDLRWEWFFAPLELVSVGAFYKDLDQPIEKIVRSFSGQTVTSFDNSESAYLYGFEFEGRKDFGFIDEALKGLQILLNVTWTDSESKRGERGQGEIQTRDQGPLVGQAPFVINAVLEYDHPDYGNTRLLYNTVDDTLDDLGRNGLPDIFLTRRDQLDFTWSKSFQVGNRQLSAKFAVENILNDAYLWTQGDQIQQRYRNGVTFDVGMSYRW
jgi:hypothetical protein